MNNLITRLLRFLRLRAPEVPAFTAPTREVRLPVDFAGLIAEHKVTVLNVSKGGIGIRCDEEFPMDETVRNLGLLIDERTYVNLWVKPVWRTRLGDGSLHVGFQIAESPENWPSYLEGLR